MTPPIIIPLKQPIAIRPEYITQKNSILHFRGHVFSNNLTVTDETDGLAEQLFTTSERFWGGRRILRENRLGSALLELRRSARKFSVLVPESAQSTAAVQLQSKFTWSGRLEIDVNVVNLAAPYGDNEIVRLRIAGQSMSNSRINVYLGDSSKVVMTVKRDIWSPQSDWWVAVAEGFDLSLAAAILICMDTVENPFGG